MRIWNEARLRRTHTARRPCTALAALAALFALPSGNPAQALPVSFDYGNVGGSLSAASYGQCGGRVITARTQGAATNVQLTPGDGIGTGANANLDDGEVLVIDFPGAPLGIAYTLDSSVDVDMDGMVGETLLSAFEANGAPLGSALVSGSGPIDVTTSLGVGRIDVLEIAPQGDRIVVRTISHEPSNGDLVGLNLANIGNLGLLSYAQCGFTITPPANAAVTAGQTTGLGIQGTGANAFVIDPGEFVDIAFAEEATDLEVKMRSAAGGVVAIAAVASDGFPLTPVNFNFSGGDLWRDVSTLFGDQPLLSVRLTVSSGLLQITGTRAVPEPSAALVGIAALASLAGLRVRCGRSG